VPDAYLVFELPEKAEEVLEIVDQIPEGKVLTYGDVAELVGSRGARFVGNVMSRYGSDVPWWRSSARVGGRRAGWRTAPATTTARRARR
jgi:alkylated DNA nucleotide flippase Atl1